MNHSAQHITGAILAGGQGRRLGGRDKGWLEWAGRPFIEHIIQRLRPQVHGLVISANRHIQQYQNFGWPVISDELTHFAGPLAGMYAVLKAAPTDYVLFTPCDTPLIPPDFSYKLSRALHQEQADIAIACDATTKHILHCLVPTKLTANVAQALYDGTLKVRAWQQQFHCTYVEFPAHNMLNINTAQQLAALNQQLESVHV